MLSASAERDEAKLARVAAGLTDTLRATLIRNSDR